MIDIYKYVLLLNSKKLKIFDKAIKNFISKNIPKE